jgi:aspartate/methionine/tyrosine aminotransferase
MEIRPFALERYFARYEFSARFLLSSSDCDGLAMSELLDGADEECRELWQELSLGYTESLGHPRLRAQIAALYDHIVPEGVLVGAPEELIYVTMVALLEEGDHVVCTFPGYQSLYSVAEALGCEVARWMPREEEGWRLDPSDLAAVLRPSTRLVVVNAPHNPTGSLPSAAQWTEILGLVAASGAALFSDEMYRLLELDPDERLPAAADALPGALSLSGMSKVYGMAGTRIGWLACAERSLIERIAPSKDYTTICSSAPSEILALIGLRRGAEIVGRHRERARRNLAELDGFMERRSDLFSWARPRAGTVCLPRLEAEGMSAEALARRAVEEAGIMLAPARLFDWDDRHVRVGFGREDMPEVLARFEDFLAAAYPAS